MPTSNLADQLLGDPDRLKTLPNALATGADLAIAAGLVMIRKRDLEQALTENEELPIDATFLSPSKRMPFQRPPTTPWALIAARETMTDELYEITPPNRSRFKIGTDSSPGPPWTSHDSPSRVPAIQVRNGHKFRRAGEPLNPAWRVQTGHFFTKASNLVECNDLRSYFHFPAKSSHSIL